MRAGNRPFWGLSDPGSRSSGGRPGDSLLGCRRVTSKAPDPLKFGEAGFPSALTVKLKPGKAPGPHLEDVLGACGQGQAPIGHLGAVDPHRPLLDLAVRLRG